MSALEQSNCPHCKLRPSSEIVVKTPTWRVVAPLRVDESPALWIIEPTRHLTSLASLSATDNSSLQAVMRHAAKLARSRYGAQSVFFQIPEPNNQTHLHWDVVATRMTQPKNGMTVFLTSEPV